MKPKAVFAVPACLLCLLSKTVRVLNEVMVRQKPGLAVGPRLLEFEWMELELGAVVSGRGDWGRDVECACEDCTGEIVTGIEAIGALSWVSIGAVDGGMLGGKLGTSTGVSASMAVSASSMQLKECSTDLL